MLFRDTEEITYELQAEVSVVSVVLIELRNSCTVGLSNQDFVLSLRIGKDSYYVKIDMSSWEQLSLSS